MMPQHPLQAAAESIDERHPLMAPLHFNLGHIGPRLERLEAKVSYMAEYVAYLEQRIATLEGRAARE